MFRSLVKLAGANTLAQALSLIVMPIITRLHTPDSLGKYQFFTTLALVMIPVMSGSLALAIRSAASEYKALSNLKFAMHFSFICFAVFSVVAPAIVLLLLESDMEWFGYYLPMLVVFVYLSANFQFAMAFFTNRKQYGREASYTVKKSIIFNALKLGFSLLSRSGFSLVLALLVTEIAQTFQLLKSNYNSFCKMFFKFRWRVFVCKLSRERTYPTYVTMTAVLNILMSWFPILITGVLYGPGYAGLLGLAFMVVNTPIYPFIGALRNVCFGELARDRSRAKLTSVYSKSMLIALIPSIAGLVALGIYGGDLFVVVFGAEWEEAGRYAFICFIPTVFSFVLSPIYTTLNHFFSFQKKFFLINVAFLFVGVLATGYIGYRSFDFDWFIVSYALVMGSSHLALFIFSVLRVCHCKELASKGS